jgi:mRNA-degrading endonuclease RelE of RelBE toxin-antitoxin system
MIRVLLTERIKKTLCKLPPDVRGKASRAIADVSAAFGDPHQHHGLGLRKLARRSYEIRVHLQ